VNKLLIIEDDALVAKFYSAKFRSEGFEVETLGDGTNGLERIVQTRPDVVILDLMLPTISGVELLKVIRAHPLVGTTPVIAFSNAFMGGMVQDAWKAGVNACMTKASCSPAQLIEVVRREIGKAAARAESPAAAPETSPATSLKLSPQATPDSFKAERPQPRPETQPAQPAPGLGDGGGPGAGGLIDGGKIQRAMLDSFVASVPTAMAGIRGSLQGLVKSQPGPAQAIALADLFLKVRSFAGSASLAGLMLPSKIASALEALVKELQDKPQSINSSSLRTVAQSVDFLAVLIGSRENLPKFRPQEAKILAVDDEVISLKAVVFALEKAELKATSVGNPVEALELLGKETFDLVVLDIEMPGMTGIELCQKLRSFPTHKTTPVVFVSGLSDFSYRAKTALAGGNDLIGKPFLLIELAIKALTHIIRARMAAAPKLQ